MQCNEIGLLKLRFTVVSENFLHAVVHSGTDQDNARLYLQQNYRCACMCVCELHVVHECLQW